MNTGMNPVLDSNFSKCKNTQMGKHMKLDIVFHILV